MTMKTVDVAKSLGIHPSTVLKWVKMADIELERNESGHCEFTEENIEALRDFQKNRNRQAVVKVVEKKKIRTITRSDLPSTKLLLPSLLPFTKHPAAFRKHRITNRK